MRDQIDVLAVIDLAADRAALIPELSEDLKQARAAVAELIEACESLEKYPDDLEIQAQFVRALARVKGA
ncbi:hypothetical protein [Stenotrophomonas indicatrix]|uniref:hypothetical protein n=1 Tax=Stenotrophomonas indicatrix TaxID=2045451 RepID=UPI001AA15A91|nr:hypothetical protein [Stenotrophomonas indicatrix]MBO1748930.1 hypothetical protein [Stenotrophomonas indicatrix]